MQVVGHLAGFPTLLNTVDVVDRQHKLIERDLSQFIGEEPFQLRKEERPEKFAAAYEVFPHAGL